MAFRQLEWLLRTKIQNGLNTIRSNPEILDSIFNDLSANSLSQLKDWLAQTDIPLVFSHPKYVSAMPCWAISLSGEAPTNIPIGTVMDSDYDVNANPHVTESYGEYVRKGYQIFTLANHPDFTLVLSTILQHILKSMRSDLTNLGFYEMSVSQQDALDLKTDLLPNYLFTRVTFVSVLVEDTFTFIDTQASTVAIGPLGGQDSDGFIQIDFPNFP